jgi:hypothetical protein
MKRISILLTVLAVMAVASLSYALSAQNAAAPGEVLTNDTDSTTAVLMKGVFAVDVINTATAATLLVKRSENNSTNWVIVKTITISAAGSLRKFLYEPFGDVDRSNGAYYKVVMSGSPTGGTCTVRVVR